MGSGPPWGQNSTGPPDQNPGSAPDLAAFLPVLVFRIQREILSQQVVFSYFTSASPKRQLRKKGLV